MRVLAGCWWLAVWDLLYFRYPGKVIWDERGSVVWSVRFLHAPGYSRASPPHRLPRRQGFPPPHPRGQGRERAPGLRVEVSIAPGAQILPNLSLWALLYIVARVPMSARQWPPSPPTNPTEQASQASFALQVPVYYLLCRFEVSNHGNRDGRARLHSIF